MINNNNYLLDHSYLRIERAHFMSFFDFKGKFCDKESQFDCKLLYSLPPKIDDQVRNISLETFGIIDQEKFFVRPYAHLIALEQEHVIGIVNLFRRTIVYNNKKINVGGFGGVATIKQKRRKGVSKTLLKIGMTHFDEQNLDVAFLICDHNNKILHMLYSKFGFVLLRNPYVYSGLSGIKHIGRDLMIAPIKSREKFKEILMGIETLDVGEGLW